jgi:hypothetical protein
MSKKNFAKYQAVVRQHSLELIHFHQLQKLYKNAHLYTLSKRQLINDMLEDSHIFRLLLTTWTIETQEKDIFLPNHIKYLNLVKCKLCDSSTTLCEHKVII